MEMALEQKRANARRDQTATPPARDETFTPDELAEILREANRREGSSGLATIDQALETARELGIDETRVLEAAEAIRERKARREQLSRRSRSYLMKLVRYLGTTVFVVALVSFIAGVPTGRLVAFGMGIGAIVMTAQWIRAVFDARFPDR